MKHQDYACPHPAKITSEKIEDIGWGKNSIGHYLKDDLVLFPVKLKNIVAILKPNFSQDEKVKNFEKSIKKLCIPSLVI